MFATDGGHASTVQVLIDAKADVDAKEKVKLTWGSEVQLWVCDNTHT
jgi:hypothetical protein